MEQPAPLKGVRLLEFGGEVSVRYAGRLLGALGAEVARVPTTHDDDSSIGHGGPAGRAYGRWLDQGKRRSGSPRGSYDVVLTGQDPETVTAAEAVVAGLDGAPPLVAIRWFAAEGPYADWPGTDEVVLALCGAAYSFGEASGPPTLAQGHEPQLMAGADACAGALAALLSPPEARPRRIDVEVFRSAMCLTETGAAAAFANARATSACLGINRLVPTYPCSSYRSADGWVGVTCLTPAQWRALCRLAGREDLGFDPDFATAYRRLMRADEVDSAIAPAMTTRTTAEWVAAGLSHRIPITAMPEPAELPGVDHWRQRGSFATVDGVSAPLLPLQMSFDGHRVDRWTADPWVAGPLSGLRVVDFTMGWAGALATRMLGDLGADVIKIESEDHPDWWRGWEADAGGDPPAIEVQPHFNAMNRSKRSVCLSLEAAAGRQTALDLIAGADVVIDNFGAGVLDKLGLGPDVQQRARPGLVTLSMPAFGGSGPLAGVRAYGSTVEQASGLPFVNGRDDWPPSLQHVAFGDPLAGQYAAISVLAALVGRPDFGGARIDLAQVACLFEMAADAIVAAQVDGKLPRTGNRRRRAIPCCVVRTQGDGHWLAVVVPTGAAWRGLAQALGMVAWLEDESLASAAGREQRMDEIEEAIAMWAADLRDEEAAATLRERGVPAAPVRPAHLLPDDPHLLATGHWQLLERRYVGRHLLAACPLRLDGAAPAPRRPAPILGEHTVEVLSELGLVDSGEQLLPRRG
ncbi:MAG: CaiB/BaiF CoA-transferase family protein [Acidimicrobiales bacterium]